MNPQDPLPCLQQHPNGRYIGAGESSPCPYLYTLWNKNQAACDFVSPAPEAT
jgi:hypothetical protein